MADRNQIFSDKMYYDEAVYQPQVHLDSEGFYRWRYRLDIYHDRKMYQLLLKICAGISLIGLVGGFFYARVPLSVLRQDPSRYQTLLWQNRILYALLGYAAFFVVSLLMIGLVRLMEGGPSQYWYRMNAEFIQIKPSGKGSGINTFSEVKRVTLSPSVNEIRLISRWGKCPVLVRSEDYEFVKKHILRNIPESAEIETR